MTDLSVETDNDAEAFWDARFDNPFIGPITSEFQAFYDDKPIQLLPIDSMEWTVPWGDKERLHTAVENEDGTLTITVNEKDTVRLTYTFDPAIKWFRGIQFFQDQADAPSKYLSFERMEPGFGSELRRYSLDRVFERNFRDSSFPYSATIFNPTGNETDFWMDIKVSCEEPGTFDLAVQHVDGPLSPSIQEYGICPSAPDWPEFIIESPAPGRWVALITVNAESGSIVGSAYLRTLETFTV